MDEQHPITPPDELVEQWRTQAPIARDAGATRVRWIATQAARWGADTQLAKACTWLTDQSLHLDGSYLRAAMRPKPPSLAEQAKKELAAVRMSVNRGGYQCDTPIINRALNRLAELEALSDD